MHFVKAKGLLSAGNGMNIYRGCTHGCIYCDSRSKCYGFTHDFEDIEVKGNAPELLEDALRRKRVRCVVGTGSMCDPYIPLERELGLTRRCLEIIERHGFGLSILTKSDLILRDLDLLKEIHKNAKCTVQITLTTYKEELCSVIEPNVCSTARRAEVLKIMRDNGIPTVVWLSPILPFINDMEENVRGILEYCKRAEVKGIVCFGMGVTLREGDREYFYSKLDEHFPGLREKYHRRYGYSYEVPSDRSPELMKLFYSECRENGIMCDNGEVFAYMNTLPPQEEQISLI